MIDTLHAKIGGFVIRIIFHDTAWGYSKNRLRQDFYRWYTPFFINPQKPDCVINIKWNDRFGILSTGKGRACYGPLYRFDSHTAITCYYQSSITEFNFAIASVMNRLFARKHGFFIHASSIIANGEAVLFMGKSGAGKSTAVALLGDQYDILSDDVLVIRKEKGRYVSYQTPFVEKNHKIRKRAGCWPVSRIYRLKQSHACAIEPLMDKTSIIDIVTDEKKMESGIYKKQYRSIVDFLNIHAVYTLKFKNNKASFVRFFKSINH